MLQNRHKMVSKQKHHCLCFKMVTKRFQDRYSWIFMLQNGHKLVSKKVNYVKVCKSGMKTNWFV